MLNVITWLRKNIITKNIFSLCLHMQESTGFFTKDFGFVCDRCHHHQYILKSVSYCLISVYRFSWTKVGKFSHDPFD